MQRLTRSFSRDVVPRARDASTQTVAVIILRGCNTRSATTSRHRAVPAIGATRAAGYAPVAGTACPTRIASSGDDSANVATRHTITTAPSSRSGSTTVAHDYSETPGGVRRARGDPRLLGAMSPSGHPQNRSPTDPRDRRYRRRRVRMPARGRGQSRPGEQIQSQKSKKPYLSIMRKY